MAWRSFGGDRSTAWVQTCSEWHASATDAWTPSFHGKSHIVTIMHKIYSFALSGKQFLFNSSHFTLIRSIDMF